MAAERRTRDSHGQSSAMNRSLGSSMSAYPSVLEGIFTAENTSVPGSSLGYVGSGPAFRDPQTVNVVSRTAHGGVGRMGSRSTSIGFTTTNPEPTAFSFTVSSALSTSSEGNFHLGTESANRAHQRPTEAPTSSRHILRNPQREYNHDVSAGWRRNSVRGHSATSPALRVGFRLSVFTTVPKEHRVS
jgi:hypothetical protein